MPVLSNQRHEQFAQHLAQGLSATRAYTQVYGESKGAAQSGHKLLRNAEICSRLIELQNEVAAGVVKLEIADKNSRVAVLQDLLDRSRRLIAARAKDLADIPGGETGLLVKDYKGKDADTPVYKADTALMTRMEAACRQAAEELGQWVTRSESTVIDVAEIMDRLNAGRKRARAAWEQRQLGTIVP